MKFVNLLFWLLWRIWFYIVLASIIMLLFPLLIISILKEEWYPFFFRLAQLWAWGILYAMGFYPKIVREQEFKKGESYMLIANHTSMTDVMLMLIIAKNPFVFVGKKELSKIPLFGFFYKRTCILVDRDSPKSRMEVYQRAQKRLNQGLSICIFPEGLVPEDESVILADFKDGAFRLAIEHQIPIVPMTFYDNKKRFSYTFFSGSPGIMRAKVHEFIPTAGFTVDDKKAIRDKAWDVIYKELNKENN
ncbi:1-acyl-sn-glycerol-3-phosphate acyltransferase [Flavobacterium piscinae]|uniref:1-acyl-sn-glycerol-3-phosphate acyltransferase n=1 Tax=Flavobacterium piscinae TaxID=2506424 RepID=A0A4Q1KTR1_9FLAO|nr:lysophospholipid acyltransferase family protein [Flavobacterium piscinae]RXR33571.1 1-acyl-sn-glycerol-3-phosphate acyltransferase [Flavobacterium piscinae]